MPVTTEQAQECLKNISKLGREIEFFKFEQDRCVYFNIPKISVIHKYEVLLKLRLDELYKERTHILEAISKIENIEYRTLLEMKYLSNWSAAKISMEMHYSERNIWYMHKKALVEMAAYLDEEIISAVDKSTKCQDMKYYIKCEICGEKHKISELKRVHNGYVCLECYKEMGGKS